MDKPSNPAIVSLAPPAVSSLRASQATAMARSISQDIREEREELREAAEQTLNAIAYLNLDGTIKWVSPSWTDVVGTTVKSVEGVPISDLIASENKCVFTDVVDSMKRDDSKSHRVRFSVILGPLSKLRSLDSIGALDSSDVPPTEMADLEAQGIMVYDSVSGGESHTMWMIRPWIPHEVQIDLPAVIVDSLGSGAEILAGILTRIAEAASEESEEPEPPPPVLCRICERQIPPWWFEKHTDLCLQEHRAEMDVQMAQESLSEHRNAIVRVLDALETRKSRSLSGDSPNLPVAEYKGQPIGPPPSAQSSPGTSLARSRERPGGFGHARARSFAIRRPQARIVELLLDLCDTAIEISCPGIKESSSLHGHWELRTQSPQSESRISQVLQWQSPSSNTLEQEQGLALLCEDTEKAARTKVDAVFRHRQIIEYAERIRIEFAVLVQDCIDEATRKAARIAEGRFSDSSEDELDEQQLPDTEDIDAIDARSEVDEPQSRTGDEQFEHSITSPSALAAALRQVDMSGGLGRSRPTSFVGSTRSSSPRECPTPRSHPGGLSILNQSRDSRRGSTLPVESDIGESEGSLRSSSVASRGPHRTESPISDFGDLRRAASSRRHRRSLIIPETSSPRRQESPSRMITQPSSPLRIKARVIPLGHEGIVSPEASPMFPSSEFSSPVTHPSRHHRRQSSAAISDFVMKPPPSPRLNANNQPPPQPRSSQPSIKDFEIIKPISKGAFGSVYLSKKKSTGEYFAIKVLKKADMVAKNQVGNVKAERAIMMWQGQSDFVAKLYWTFSSKDYLYLVMEYLNGGDCASLIKVLGGLPEDWVKKYLGEVVLGVEHLHERGVIHRDLKPDNLLIDQKGHLKLTDFGLSRMGLVGRQKRALNSDHADSTPDLLKQGPFVRSTSMASSRSTSLDVQGHSPGATPQMTPDPGGPWQPSYFSLGPAQQPDPRRISNSHRSDSGGSETLSRMLTTFSIHDLDAGSQPPSARSFLDEDAVIHASPDLAPYQSNTRTSMDSHSRGSLPPPGMVPPPMALFDPEDTNRRFVGTPDYLAPETIKGDKQDETSDWWSVGCIMFEFLYGIPPFHAGEAEQVFENILARKIQWPDEADCEPVSDEAKDLINKLLCMDPPLRLGSNREDKFASGGEEIRNHPWFEGVNWDSLLEDEAQFVPQPENPEDTEYFDARGAVLHSFVEEIEDQTSPQSSTAGSNEYPDRPHDALSRVRSQVNSMGRKLMPLHIPPHVRDLKSRRLSEPIAADDFGSFSFKNLPVLEKANKDVIQKLRAEALAVQSKQASVSPGGLGGGMPSPAPSLEGSPVVATHVQRTLSNAKAGNRPQSPSGISLATASPNRISQVSQPSQPSSPLMNSFIAGHGPPDGRRKASSNSSSLSYQSTSSSLQPNAAAIDVPKVPPSLQRAATSAAASPVKPRGGGGTAPPPLALSPGKVLSTPVRQGSTSSTSRSRSLTVGSQEASPIATDMLQHHHRNRRSQVFDMSPSSSDNEGDKHNALLRVQRRRQSSRRLSQIAFDSGPTFRPLDVLICEDHPVSRMVMEKLLEKLRCRTISVANGSEAVRFSMSEIKFDIIFIEYRLPQINGVDVARMIRETKNANSHTPIVAITAYLKELQAPHHFDSLIEKPISSSKLSEVLRGLCQWQPESPHRPPLTSITAAIPLNLRRAHPRQMDDSPTSSISAFIGRHGSAMVSSREDSIASSMFDSESYTTEDIPVVISRKATGDWEDSGGLGISDIDATLGLDNPTKSTPSLVCQQSAPAHLEVMSRGLDNRLKVRHDIFDKKALEGTESADDEDEELEGRRDMQLRRGSKAIIGKGTLPSSKLGIEMMRADSHDSVTLSDSTSEAVTQVATTPSLELERQLVGMPPDLAVVQSTPSKIDVAGAESEDAFVPGSAEATPRPPAGVADADRTGSATSVVKIQLDGEDETTPRPLGK